MIKIQVDHDLDEMQARLSKVEKEKWPRILSYATTETGFYARNKVIKEMPKHIDKPKPFTRNSLFVKKGNTRDPEATVMWRPGSLSGNSAGRYLMPQVKGGNRQEKRWEKLLQAKGVMPQGYYAVPTKDAPTDAYGNVPGSYIVRILSFVRAFRDRLQNRNLDQKKAARKKLQFFAIPPGRSSGGMSPGIYERISLFGGAIRQVFFFSRRAAYNPKFPFYDIANKAAADKFNEKLDEGIKKAINGERGF